jgi:hypothetical protein
VSERINKAFTHYFSPREKMMHPNNDKTKVMAAIQIAGIIVAAALLSGLLCIFNSYQPAIAQENMTGNASTTTSGGAAESSACALAETTGSQNATTTNATITTSGGSGGAATTLGNVTSTTAGAGGANLSLSEVRLQIEEACIAAQNNDTQRVLIHLNLALNALDNATQANLTTTSAGGDSSTTTVATTGGGGTTTSGGGGTTTSGGGGTTTSGGGGTTTSGGGGTTGRDSRPDPTDPGPYGNVVR